MTETTPLWRDARGIYQDKGRDSVPSGFVWNLLDYVPDLSGAPLRGRGAWTARSTALASPSNALIYATYEAGDKLMAVTTAGQLYEISISGAAAATAAPAVVPTLQNPFMHRDRVIIPAADGVTAARFVTFTTGWAVAAAPASALTGRYGVAWKDYVALGNSSVEPQRVSFSGAGDPTLAWETDFSLVDTSYPITGMAAQRTQILCFHNGSVERIRGTKPPASGATNPVGDLILDLLFDRAGCFDARSIAHWNDNVIFADARGIHVTDGAIVRNMAAQGGVLRLWRTAMDGATSVAGVVYGDYYICTVRSAAPPETFVCYIPGRQFHRFTNIDSAAYAYATADKERIFGTDSASSIVTEVTAAFEPNTTVLQIDADGTPVLPVLETAYWKNKMGGWSRFLDLFIAYETGSIADDGSAVLRLGVVGTPADASYETIGTFRRSPDMVRRKLALRRRHLGLGVRVEQLLATRDTRLYAVDGNVYPEEATTV